MNIQHEIINFDSNTGSLLVRYFTDAYPQGLSYNIDLPVVDGVYPSYEAVLDLINHMAPKGQLERAVSIATTPVPYYLKSYAPLEPGSLDTPVIVGTDLPPTA
jgi:hypothetical protein